MSPRHCLSGQKKAAHGPASENVTVFRFSPEWRGLPLNPLSSENLSSLLWFHKTTPPNMRIFVQNSFCRTGFFAGRGLQPRPEYFPDRRPQTFRTGLQTPSGSRPSFLA
ncbi:Uncharacterized protein dnm_078900 [Desulfonema magnum]|uniref:Uncharacterized protein n=1 Tax=Desulfonema magnum TaxID=45655 RepID=A0A975BU57_9BACT|nr:Uncharacterized protein dnm_078900 [Desulfonema magnum]